MKILGINVDSLTRKEALEKLSAFLHDEKQHFLTTPNPEIVLAGYRNRAFGEILNKADLALPDGVGLTFAAWFLGTPIKARLPGSDLVFDIANIAESSGARVYFVGSEDGVAIAAAQNIKQKFPKLIIAGAESGIDFKESEEKRAQDNYALLNRINTAQADILLVGFGQKKQETWIYENLSRVSSVKIAIGIGGTFDFLAGKIRRAPRIMRAIGFEWLWRFVQEPRKRARRIWDAVVVFSFLIIMNRIWQKNGSN